MNPNTNEQIIIVDDQAHRNTRVDMRRGAAYGESIHLVSVIPHEFNRLLTHFPIFFARDNDSGDFGLAAMLGFEVDENLFLDGDQWTVDYVPLHMQRGPFTVGPSDDSNTQLVACIDANDPRVQEQEGERLYTDEGERTEFMKTVNSILAELVRGTAQTREFVEALTRHDLIEQLALNVQFANGDTLRFDNLYTVSSEKLAALRGDALESLHERGYLKLAYEIIASISGVGRLIDIKNRRLDAIG